VKVLLGSLFLISLIIGSYALPSFLNQKWIEKRRAIHAKRLGFSTEAAEVDDMELPQYPNVTSAIFTQRTDHFDVFNNATFGQRYFYQTLNWDGTGPIFFMLGQEGASSPQDVVDGYVAEMAASVGALVVELEHRYYGYSVPIDLETDNMVYLSVEQALEDFAHFRVSFGEMMNATDNVWISFGCSYSGAMSAWLRLRYPQLIDAALSGSSPVFADVAFAAYDQTISYSLSQNSTQCLNITRTALREADSYFETSTGRSKLEEMFSTCQPLNETDNSLFQSAIYDPIAEDIQYNLALLDYPRTELCGVMMANAESPLEGLAALNAVPEGDCLDIQELPYFQDLNITNDNRKWMWQTCTEFGYFQIAPPHNNLMSEAVNITFFKELCTQSFGRNVWPDGDIINKNFGANQTESSNIFFANGYEDPWHTLSTLDPPSALMHSEIWSGSGHCAVWEPMDDAAPPSVTAIQNDMLTWVKQFL